VLLSMVLVLGFILRCTFWSRPKRTPVLCDASTQTDGNQDMTNRELDASIARRIACLSFALFLERDVMFRDNYNLRLEYKSAGARYDGTLRRWLMRACSDLRPILYGNPGWIENPELVYRESLFMTLHMIDDAEDLF
ncbi:MAG: hypothetical protein ACKPKO_05560, partial [Candidatus Fonsibacter sp.]